MRLKNGLKGFTVLVLSKLCVGGNYLRNIFSNSLCRSTAIKYAKDKVPLLREKMSLLKEMGEHSRELIVKKMLLKYLPEDRGDEYLELAREMTKVL